MNLRAKLRMLGLLTLIGLGLVAFVTIRGLRSIEATEEAAHRRQAYVADLVQIKANAMSTIMLDPTMKETKDIFAEAAATIEQHGKKSIDIIRRAEVREELKKILEQWNLYLGESQKLIRLAEQDARAANEKLQPLYLKTFKPFQEALDRFVEVRVRESTEGVQQAKTVAANVFWQVCSLLGIVSVLNVLAILAVTRAVQSGLSHVLNPMPALQAGDLTQAIPPGRKDEFGEIAAGVNGFVNELRNLIQHTRNRSDVLAASASQLAAASEGLLQGNSQQNDAAASVAASVEQFSTSIDQVSDNSGQAEQKAHDSGKLSQLGSEEVLRAVADFRKIEQTVSEAAQQMQTLGQKARDIGGIASVIKEVADQTNLLALNAAIEAARAGEQGRGFAVVADEVRKLAERTNRSAQEITETVTSVQLSAEETSAVMDEGRELVVQSVQHIEQAGQSMQEISAGSVEVVSAIGEISTALREQRTAGAEIARNVERIAQMTEVGRDSAASVTAAAQQMAQVAEQLQQDVAKFRL